ncbi:N-methyl-L-tryptophan oxidase [Microbacterium marinilacus]|uniref:N-methyl-L-tryptophan oxidase n=1 Tax=Microbacterium marinilacus TaxID=415209 RepID=A0ABP7BIE4_9MICO|nr:N-methyl-L-tryptophan oxidase [Microbacterium marinilacus]MBY0689776.1 N-methyl-L-tryptophan oxidase [Microbacterium marinilacus]
METFDVAVVGMGALGSAAAYHLARKGVKVVAFEQFELGHVRGASHDTSRIIRTSYGNAAYVRLAEAAYRDWAEFEEVAGEQFTSITGGLVFIPTSGPYSASDFARSLDDVGIPYELLSPAEVHERWPQFSIPEGVETVYTPDSGIVHAARSVTAFQMQARVHGAVIRPRTPVERITPDDEGVIVHTPNGDVRARKVILATDAWTNALLEPLGARIPLVTMQEQVTYFKPKDPDAFDRESFPVWIWEDESCFYGFPTYGEPTIKAARDVGNNYMTPEERTFVPSDELLSELTSFMGSTIPGSGEVLRTVTCQYALTPDRRFVLGPLDEHPDVIVALGAGHAFKFTPAIGRIVAELAVDGSTSDDVSAFTVSGALAAAAKPAATGGATIALD